MSDIMLLGVLGMLRPDDPRELSPVDWLQLKGRIEEARKRIADDTNEIERLRAEIERLTTDLINEGEVSRQLNEARLKHFYRAQSAEASLAKLREAIPELAKKAYMNGYNARVLGFEDPMGCWEDTMAFAALRSLLDEPDKMQIDGGFDSGVEASVKTIRAHLCLPWHIDGTRDDKSAKAGNEIIERLAAAVESLKRGTP